MHVVTQQPVETRRLVRLRREVAEHHRPGSQAIRQGAGQRGPLLLIGDDEANLLSGCLLEAVIDVGDGLDVAPDEGRDDLQPEPSGKLRLMVRRENLGRTHVRRLHRRPQFVAQGCQTLLDGAEARLKLGRPSRAGGRQHRRDLPARRRIGIRNTQSARSLDHVCPQALGLQTRQTCLDFLLEIEQQQHPTAPKLADLRG